MVVSSPTGSGKTVVLELAMLRLLRHHISATGALPRPHRKSKCWHWHFALPDLSRCTLTATARLPAGAWQPQRGRLKAVYVAPNKALVQERVADWRARFAYLGVVVVECTGDSDTQDEGAALLAADVIATTPCAPPLTTPPARGRPQQPYAPKRLRVRASSAHGSHVGVCACYARRSGWITYRKSSTNEAFAGRSSTRSAGARTTRAA